MIADQTLISRGRLKEKKKKMTSGFQNSKTGTLVTPFIEIKKLKVSRSFSRIWEVENNRSRPE